jgi:hypothetical protein
VLPHINPRAAYQHCNKVGRVQVCLNWAEKGSWLKLFLLIACIRRHGRLRVCYASDGSGQRLALEKSPSSI